MFIGGVMVSRLPSNVIDRLKPKTMKLVFIVSSLSSKKKEQRLVGSDSGYCVRVGQDVYT